MSARKKLFFAAITVVVLFAAVEAALMVLGVRPVLYDEDPYVGFSSYIPLFVEQTDANGQKYMVTAKNKLKFFNPQQFAEDKPSGTYRIFCAGGSTTFGRPYDDMTSFCGWLREMLPKADPSRRWELINVGGVSYASYRVALLMEELVRYEPDLFIVYSGHNEFLEHRTYSRVIGTPAAMRGLGAILSRTRTYTAVKHAVDAMGKSSDVAAEERTYLPGEVETILQSSAGPESYHRDAELREKVLDHYRYNLMRMVDIARSVGAEVILVTPASNLRHCSPFKSQHRAGLSNPQRGSWQVQFDRAGEAYAGGKWDEALAAIDEAIDIDDRHAHGHYRRGRILWELQRYDEAKAAFARAMDEDICALRAPTPMLDIVAEVAGERNVPLVDFVEIVERMAEHATPGQEQFLDHAHPTIEGNRRLALALLDTMDVQGIVRPASEWGNELIGNITRDVEGRLDVRAHGVALRNLARLFRWAGKFEEGRKLGLRALEMVPSDAGAHFVVAANVLELGYMDEAIRHYRQALELQPDYAKARGGLGDALTKQGRFDEAIGEYRQALSTDPNYSHAYGNLGVAMSAKGELGEAVGYFRRALEIEPEYTEAHNSLGTVLVAQGKLQEAIEHFRRALEIRPHYAHARYNLASVLRSQGRFDEASDEFRRILRSRPGYVYAYCGLGLALQAQGKLDEAIGSYRQALEIEPDYAEAHANLGDVFSGQGKSDEAINHYRQSLAADPNYAQAHCNLGVALATKRELQEAAAHFRQALRIDPYYAEAHNNLGSLLLAFGRPDEAISHFRRALETGAEQQQMGHPTAGRRAGVRLGEAINRYSESLRPRPDYARIHHNLGRALARTDDLAEALEHYRRAADLKPDWPTALNDAAKILATHSDSEIRNVDEAIRFAERAAELAGRQNVSILDTLALAYAAAGQFDKAAKTIETAITLASATQAKSRVDYLRKKLELYRQARL
ncbi:MAG: tetratricopeptide repeat protein [Planctomycetota bacterium]